MRNILHRLLKDTTGAAAIEFALLGPAFIVMMLGVLQVGMGLQSYNAMRNVAADVGRYAMVQYQTGNTITTSQLKTWTRNHARGTPYLLDDDRLTVTITEETSRVAGADELSIKIEYQLTSVLKFIKIDGPTIDYTRPVFLVQ